MLALARQGCLLALEVMVKSREFKSRVTVACQARSGCVGTQGPPAIGAGTQPHTKDYPHMFTITIDLSDVITIPLGRNSVYGTLDIDVARLPSTAREYVFLYGLKQVINDAMAIKTDKDGKVLGNDAVAEKALNKRDALYDGTIRMRSESVAADAYEAEAIREAKRFTIAFLTKKGHMKDIPPKTENRILYAINRYLVSQGKPETTEADYLAAFFAGPNGETVRERARKIVDDRRALEADMDELV